MKNILIPTDFSENSNNAIRYALEYFSNIPANFFILHASGKSHAHKSNVSESFYEFEENTQVASSPTVLLRDEIKSFQLLSKNPSHYFHALEENLLLVEAIKKQVIENDIDIILMGTKGDSQTHQADMGSQTYDVITKVKCPILVVPENAIFQGIRNFAFVTDYNCLYRSRVINTLSDALQLHTSPLRVLNIRPQNTSLNVAQTDNKGFLHYFFKEIKHSFHILENKNIENGIQDFVDTWEISVVAIVAKNLNFIQRLMLRPTSGKFNYHTEVPFLVLHE